MNQWKPKFCLEYCILHGRKKWEWPHGVFRSREDKFELNNEKKKFLYLHGILGSYCSSFIPGEISLEVSKENINVVHWAGSSAQDLSAPALHFMSFALNATEWRNCSWILLKFLNFKLFLKTLYNFSCLLIPSLGFALISFFLWEFFLGFFWGWRTFHQVLPGHCRCNGQITSRNSWTMSEWNLWGSDKNIQLYEEIKKTNKNYKQTNRNTTRKPKLRTIKPPKPFPKHFLLPFL